MSVASELRFRHKDTELIYIGERGGKFAHMVHDSELFDERYFISAGKLRRYHGQSSFASLLDVKTLYLNLRDIFRLIAGVFQAYSLIRRIKPDAMLLKGGFVCVPVAIAARLNKVPYITHDSDALPGLANRLAARWAKYHATALPAKHYSYPPASIRTVGVPVDPRFSEYTPTELRTLRREYGVNGPADSKVLLITGGSLGARRLNEVVIKILPKLLGSDPDLYVFHQLGAGNQDQAAGFPEEYSNRVKFFDFSPKIFQMSAIADVIVTRAGASAIADYAAQNKTLVIVPNPYLAGGHQMKNAEVYAESDAAVIVNEKEMMADFDLLYSAIISLLSNPERREKLAHNLHSLTPTHNAARSIADLLEEIAS